MRCLAHIAIILCCALPGAPLLAAALEAGETGRIESVVDGDTVALESGTIVRLVGIQAPKLPLGRPGFVAWPAGVTLYYGGARRDR